MNNNINVAFFKAAARHFVTLSVTQTSPQLNEKNAVLISGFVINVESMWFYVTAGHVIRDVQEARAAGSEFNAWRLGDQGVCSSFDNTGIPFDFVTDDWIVIRDRDTGLDYAALWLRDLYQRALEAGGVIPLGPDAWGDHLTEYDQWVLVGIPAETVVRNGNNLTTAKFVSVPIKEAEAPEGAGTRSNNQFYGHLPDGSESTVNSVEGMSGGPIFATTKNEGTLSYKVIGVQSAWYPDSRIIAACPFSSLGIGLESAVRIIREKTGR